MSFETKAGSPRVGLIGIRHDENSSFLRGAAEAPPLIREALFSSASNLWSESGLDLGQPGILFDAGDVSPGNGAGALAEIEDAITALLERGLLPLALGGDHSITHPILRAFARRHSRLSILQIDAHPDLYDEFEGSRHSHACPFARIMEEGLAGRLVQVGIRTLNAHQREQARRFGVELIEMRDWNDDRVFSFDAPLYLSIDLDGLDPSCAPGVSHREPGGLTTRQLLRLLQSIRAPIAGADIVEFNPKMDASGVTAAVCAKLLKEVAARMLESGAASVSSSRVSV